MGIQENQTLLDARRSMDSGHAFAVMTVEKAPISFANFRDRT
jgi:hypothetical protein